jgi:uncharacterized protein YndB with AHSA1/START domain/DNA-binding transcriptional ArsR family regulator
VDAIGPLTALAEPTRLRIVELLDRRPHAVGEIAAALDLRQPQVTKHLQTLQRAGLIAVHPLGQRRICALERVRFAELRDWLGDLARDTSPSEAALETYRRAVDAETAAAAADPTWAEGRVLEIERILAATPAALWPFWTTAQRLRTWWAPEHFTVAECDVDPRPGGAMTLVLREGDGTRHRAAGHVVAAEAPHALDFEMAPLGPDGVPLFTAAYAVRLVPVANGTRLTLQARIDASTAAAAPALAGMRIGWEQSLDRLARALT